MISRSQSEAEINTAFSGNLVHRREKAAHRAAAAIRRLPRTKMAGVFDFPWDADVRLASPGGRSLSVQRLNLDDGGAVVVADPERARALRIVDMDTPDMGRARQLIFRVLAALDVKAGHAIGQHGTGPCLA